MSLPEGEIFRRIRCGPKTSTKWWDLGRGSYFVECNETLHLAADEIALIEPEDRLLRAGGWHVPLFVRGHVDPVELLLEVGVARLRVKENARLARVRLFRIEKTKTASRHPARAALRNQKRQSAKSRKSRLRTAIEHLRAVFLRTAQGWPYTGLVFAGGM